LLYHTFFAKTVADLLANAGDHAASKAIEAWFGRFMSLRWQLPLPIVCCGLSVLYMGQIQRYRGVTFTAAGYVLSIVATFYVWHGVYCAIFIPTLAKTVAAHRMKTFWLAPAETSWIRNLSYAFNALCLSEAIVLSMCFAGVYNVRPWEALPIAITSALWLVVGLCTILYAFVFPQYYLYRAITSEKMKQREFLQNLVEAYRTRIQGSGEDERKHLLQLLDLTSHLAATRETAIDMKAAASFVTSLILPILSFLAGHLKVFEFITRRP